MHSVVAYVTRVSVRVSVLRQSHLGCEVGRFKPFVWPVVLRSVRTEAVSINGMPIYLEITRNRTSLLWKQVLGVVSRNAKKNAATLAAQGIATRM